MDKGNREEKNFTVTLNDGLMIVKQFRATFFTNMPVRKLSNPYGLGRHEITLVKPSSSTRLTIIKRVEILFSSNRLNHRCDRYLDFNRLN